jgi:hypothetical protein
MINTTCAASPGGLPADARNFSFRIKKARQNNSLSVRRRIGSVVFLSAVQKQFAEARDSGQQ